MRLPSSLLLSFDISSASPPPVLRHQFNISSKLDVSSKPDASSGPWTSPPSLMHRVIDSPLESSSSRCLEDPECLQSSFFRAPTPVPKRATGRHRMLNLLAQSWPGAPPLACSQPPVHSVPSIPRLYSHSKRMTSHLCGKTRLSALHLA